MRAICWGCAVDDGVLESGADGVQAFFVVSCRGF
jgi:hypothetical protein